MVAENIKTTTLKIGDTDIILYDYEIGHGKIIISDNWRGSYSYSWGAMSSTLSEFICRINSSYFADKLLHNSYVFSAKKSVKNVRKYIREELSYELPWYKHMEFQKQLREELKGLEDCSSENEFINCLSNLHNRIDYYDIKNNFDRTEIKECLKSAFYSEPWHFIGEDLSPTYIWLCDLHKKLKKKLKK